MTATGHPPPAALSTNAPPPPSLSNAQVPMNNLQKLAQANEQAWMQMGIVAEIMMEYDRAVSCYEAALSHNPYSIAALQHAAALCRGREMFPKAIEYFQRILRIQENNGDIWGALGHCYLMIDDLQQAYHAYQQALYHLPDAKDPKLWYGIGILYDRYGSLEHAEEAFTAVMRMEPKFEKANEIYFRLGIIYKQQQKYDLSLQCFRYILNSPPRPLTEIDVWFQIGHVYEQQKEYTLAKEAYERVLQENPDHAKALQQLGWLYDQPGAAFANQEMAVNYLVRSLKIDGDDPQSWYLLGRCYMAQQNYSKAYEAYQQAVYRDGRNPTFWCSIGVLYYQINQYQDALDAYSRAIRINPMISEVWYDLGTLYESCNNQLQDALDAYQRAYELDPSNPHIKQRLTLIKQALQQGGQPATAAPMPQDVNLQAYHQNANAMANGASHHFNQPPPAQGPPHQMPGPPPPAPPPPPSHAPPSHAPAGYPTPQSQPYEPPAPAANNLAHNAASAHAPPNAMRPTGSPLPRPSRGPYAHDAPSLPPPPPYQGPPREDVKLAEYGRAAPHLSQEPQTLRPIEQAVQAPVNARPPYSKAPRPDGLLAQDAPSKKTVTPPSPSRGQQQRASSRGGSPLMKAPARGATGAEQAEPAAPELEPSPQAHPAATKELRPLPPVEPPRAEEPYPTDAPPIKRERPSLSDEPPPAEHRPTLPAPTSALDAEQPASAQRPEEVPELDRARDAMPQEEASEEEPARPGDTAKSPSVTPKAAPIVAERDQEPERRSEPPRAEEKPEGAEAETKAATPPPAAAVSATRVVDEDYDIEEEEKERAEEEKEKMNEAIPSAAESKPEESVPTETAEVGRKRSLSAEEPDGKEEGESEGREGNNKRSRPSIESPPSSRGMTPADEAGKGLPKTEEKAEPATTATQKAEGESRSPQLQPMSEDEEDLKEKIMEQPTGEENGEAVSMKDTAPAKNIEESEHEDGEMEVEGGKSDSSKSQQ
ncbi:uncharacterized protein VTP21DRAFT_882 [Calcarisporiella thermophila]|uniref:uncharacterized protein n=1 Tax=Calcarisporiella thermophila TaxID=911321 RepID=UPI0037439672